MSLSFVNCFGQPISHAHLAAMKAQGQQQARQKKATAESAKQLEAKERHKGWRVTGIPPGALEVARDGHERTRLLINKSGGKPIEPFDEMAWRRKQRGKPVRSKPYELEQAASQCAELARRGGWIDVQVIEMRG